jgi:enediyne biosynthesis protein E4
MRRNLLIALLAAMFACSAASRAQIRFVDVTRDTGLLEPLAGLMGHGGAWGDFDGDGFLDFFVGGFCDRPDPEYAPATKPVPNRLLRSVGGKRFELVINDSVSSFGRTSGAVFADLDNNGTLELYVANNAKESAGKNDPELQRSAKTQRSQLFRNDAGKLVDISADSGACPSSLHTARNIGVFDYDGDGLLDLFVVEDKFTSKPRSVLLRNLGGLRFRDVTRKASLPEDIFGLGLGVADLNGDGRPDFFVGHGNRLFLSDGKDRFREAKELAALFAHQPANKEDWPCGVAFGDLNRDGRLDLVVTAHSTTARNRVFLNDGVVNGTPRFHEITREAGLADVVPARCPHVEIQDFDNDGWPDIYTSAGWLDGDTFTPLIYRNAGISNGIPRFVPPKEIAAPMVYYPAGPSADYDNDGKLDLMLVNWFQGNHSRLLRNDSAPANWLQVVVVGKRVNRMGIGAQVRVVKSGATELLGFQEISTGYGYASGQPAIAHFGLGNETLVDVEVRLPNGKMIQQRGIKANQRLRIEEP